MKKYIILYYAHDEDFNASQAIIEAIDMADAMNRFYVEVGEIEPIACYLLGLKQLFS